MVSAIRSIIGTMSACSRPLAAVKDGIIEHVALRCFSSKKKLYGSAPSELDLGAFAEHMKHRKPEGPRRFIIDNKVLSICDSRAPGLRLFPYFLDKTTQTHIQEEGYKLNEVTQEQAKQAELRQVKTHLSRQHNLDSKECYLPISWEDSDGRTIKSQHFPVYGEEGHQLTYFIGRKNIPLFVQNNLISPISELSEIRGLMKSNQTSDEASLSLLEWNFTFNTYRCPREIPRLPGFDWHTDIPSNGKITMIYTGLGRGEFQIKGKSETAEPCSFFLDSGSLLLLSGPAREQMVHRVVPQESSSHNYPQPISRMSFVLGCHLLS